MTMINFVSPFRRTYKLPNTFISKYMSSKSIDKVGFEVELKTGEKGKILSKLKSGKWQVEIFNGQEYVTKTMKSSELVFQNTSLSKFETQSSTTTIRENELLQSNNQDFNQNNQNNTLISTINPPKPHSLLAKWIIFSDLHVKASSIDTCEEILKRVHDTALDYNAGIIFLGDFWHVRGSLSVDLLNRVLKSLRLWTQPVIMIPGNHDQVTLGGTVHSLEPLKYAFAPDQILMISEPSVCLGALWIPYRRNSTIMRSVLSAASLRSDISMVFCHVDVRGAYMNDNIQSREGLEVTDFPSNLPIYTGHFHKPHTITKRGSMVRYVGSPYQTSLSEAGQTKFLYCMSYLPSNDTVNESFSDGPHAKDRLVWKEEQRVPIHVGMKYFKASINDSKVVNDARAGDKIVLKVKVGEEYSADKLMTELKARGVDVELRHEGYKRVIAGKPTDLTMDNKNLEEKPQLVVENEESSSKLGDERDPITLFRAFMSSAGQESILTTNSTDSESNSTLETSTLDLATLFSQILDEGIATISKLYNSSDISSIHKVRNLELTQVTLSNFGPYGGDIVKYPLSKRGLVLIKAEATDGTGADSNGAGKTTLAMSVLWGLTGSMDTRLIDDSRAADVAYDAGEGQPKRTAEVVIHGFINSKPFILTRRRGPRKTELLFTLDGKDMTTQAVKDTQNIIDDVLGVGNNLLQRCCFFGQHSHTLQSLLGLTDTKLKNEMSVLVDTSIWVSALQDVRLRDRSIKSSFQELVVEKKVRNQDLKRLETELTKLAEFQSKIQTEYDQAVKKAMEEVGLTVKNKESIFGNISVDELRQKLANSKSDSAIIVSKLDTMRKELFQLTRDRNVKLKGHDDQIMKCREMIAQMNATISSLQINIQNLNQKLKQNEIQLKGLQQVSQGLLERILKISQVDFSSDNGLLNTVELNRKDVDNIRTNISFIDMKLTACRSSLVKIKDVLQLQGKNSCDSHNINSCPTCGQNLPLNMTQIRERELEDEINKLLVEKSDFTKQYESKKLFLDLLVKYKDTQDQLRPESQKEKDIKSDLSGYQTDLTVRMKESIVLGDSLKKKLQERQISEQSLQKEESEVVTQVESLEKQVKEKLVEELRLQQNIEKLQQVEQISSHREAAANATVALVEERLRTANNTVELKKDAIKLMNNSIVEYDDKMKTLKEQSIILERLGEVLGPKGIQQYLFLGAITQIEEIANVYLEVLAQGGIQLSLQGEWDSEKIIKKVMIRASDSELRERALAQLSGGQWRRVSMALDLAFAEAIRRKGTLRSNLIVMDEILTHLDAMGREAVGSVLRALVEGKKLTTEEELTETTEKTDGGQLKILDDTDGTEIFNIERTRRGTALNTELSRILLSGGAYDTVIVILQDLAAAELEEAFDHVDTVSKPGDTAMVKIDGI